MAENATTENILSISLREYKKQIDDLKGSLLGLKKGSEEYEKIAQEVRDKQAKLNEVLNDSKTISTAAVNSMAAMKKELKELKAEANQIDVGSARFKELSQQILETTDKLKELEASQGTYSRNVGNYESGVVSLKSQFKELYQEMSNMLAQGVAPTDEAFVALAKRAGDMKDAMLDSQAVIKHYADDTKTLSTVVDIAKTGAAAFGVYQGALSAFGIENENINQSLNTLVGITTTLNSLQQLQTALVDRASITYRAYQGVVELGSKALAALGLASKTATSSTVAETVATTAHTGAMAADTAATGAATVATQLFRKALIATGVGAIVVAIGTLISYLDDLVDIFKSACSWVGKATGLIKEQTTAEKIAAAQAKKHAEEVAALSKKEKELQQEGVTLKATYEKLQAIWANTKTLADRKQFVEQYKNEMSSLGVEVNNVNDAERFFSNEGAAAFAKSIEIRARLALAQSKLMQAIQKEEQAVSEQWMGDALYKVQQQKQAVLDEITNLSAQLSKFTPKSSAPKTTTTKTTSSKSTTKQDVDISGDMDALEKKLKEQIDTINYSYDLLAAKGKATADDEINRITSIYIVSTDILTKEKADREAQLENAKITAEQRKSIEKDIYDIEQQLLETQREYEVDYAKIITEIHKNKYKEIIDAAKKASDEETKAFGESNIAAMYTEMLKDAEPEIAAQIVKNLSVSDDVKEQIISNLDAVNGELDKKRYEYYLQQEEAEYQHQQNLLQIQKDALVEVGIEYGEDSEQYLAMKQSVYDREEQMARKHTENLTKIENNHSKATKKTNKLTLGNYLDMGKGVANIMDTVAGIMEDDIRNKQENGKISEEEAKKQFETVKALQIVSATINTIEGAITAYTSAQSLGPIAGPIVGGINAAAVTAMGVANIAQIKSQQFGSSGGVGNTVQAATREATNVDFSGVNVNPLLDETADINRMTTLSEQQQSEQRVYILQSDIADSQNQVQIRQSNTTF